MKKSLITLFVLILMLIITGCGSLSIFFKDNQIVIPSDKIITKTREISRVHGVELRTSGKINIHQGDYESMTITGPDNTVPLFDIQLKELNSILVSGQGHVEIPMLTTETLDILISGSSQRR